MSIRTPTLGAALQRSERWLRLFDPRERRLLVQSTAAQAGADWGEAYLPLRFNAAYARQLGYGVTAGHWKRKQKYGATLPLVWTGDMRKAIFRRFVARSSGVGARLTLTLIMGSVWPPIVIRSVLTKMPAREVTYIATQLRRHLLTLLRQRRPVAMGTEKRPRLGLTLAGATSAVPRAGTDRRAPMTAATTRRRRAA